MPCTKAATDNHIIPSAWPPQLMRHAGNRRALISALDDFSFYQSRPPRSYTDRLCAVSKAITQHARRLARETKIMEWFISTPTGAVTLPADLTFGHSTAHESQLDQQPLWTQVARACRSANGRFKTHLAELQRFAALRHCNKLWSLCRELKFISK